MSDTPVNQVTEPSYQKRLLRLLAATTFFQGYALALPSQLLDEAGLSFGFGRADLLPAFFIILIGSFGALLVAPVADLRGRRRVLTTTAFLVPILAGASGAAPSLGAFVGLSFMAQVFLVAQYAVVLTVLTEDLPSSRRGWAIGVVTATGGLGFAALSITSRVLEGGQTNWRLLSFLTLAGVIPAMFIYRRLKETSLWEAASKAEQAGRRGTAVLGRGRRQLLQIGLVFLFVYVAFMGGASWWSSFAITDLGLSEETAGNYLGAAYLIGIGGYLFGGWAADRWGRRKTGSWLMFGALLAGLGVFRIQSPGAQLPFMAIATFLGLGVSPIISAMSAELFSVRTRAASVAVTRALFATVGGVLGPLLVGILSLSENGEPERIAIGAPLVGLALIPAILLLRSLPETKDRDLGEIAAAASIPAPEVPVYLEVSGSLFPPDSTALS